MKQTIKIGDRQETTAINTSILPLQAALHTPHTIISQAYQQAADGHAAIKHTSLETSAASKTMLTNITRAPT